MTMHGGNQEDNNENRGAEWIGIGLALGAGVGVAIGTALGAGVGVAIGTALDSWLSASQSAWASVSRSVRQQ